MRMEDLKDKAKALGVKSGKMKKLDLIRAIQSAEGNFPCFGTADDYCDRSDCAFRSDCFMEE